MGSDLIALIVALGLGAVVVVVGMRRDLSEITRENLPRFGGESRPPIATEWPSEGERGRKSLSPRQARWLALLYLLIGIVNAALAATSDDGVIRGAIAALFVLGAVLMFLGKFPYSRRASAPAEPGASGS